jgi:DNA-binding beta-propeller fold protein YncE
MTTVLLHRPARRLLLAAAILASAAAARAQTLIPTGQAITPTAAPGAILQTLNPNLPDHPDFRAGQAIKTAISPDGATLLVLTSGYNNLYYSSGPKIGEFEPAASSEYVFVYTIQGPNKSSPHLAQALPIADTFAGLTFAPNGQTFYVSGGVDDRILAFTANPTGWTQSAAIPLNHQPIANTPNSGGIGFFQPPSPAGIAVTPNGNTIIVANIYNNSITLIDANTNQVTAEYDLRPYNTTPATGNGTQGGERPFAIAAAGNDKLYISSLRDREIIALSIAGETPTLITRIPLPGTPNNLIVDNPANPKTLYVAQDNADKIAVIDLATNRVTEQISTIAPPGLLENVVRYTGAAANALALSPDQKTLYVTNGAQNAVAVISLEGPAPHHCTGLIPTGWYPQSINISNDATTLYIANAKSPPAPNPRLRTTSTAQLTATQYPGGNAAAKAQAYAANEYVLQREPATLLTLPIPTPTQLATLTTQVAANNRYSEEETHATRQIMGFLHRRISHIIYIVKENRTFDQVLGDLTNGANADPSLTIFGAKITPNFHALAENFVTLDNFLTPGEVSGDGWEWSVAARETDLNEKQIPLAYASSPKPTTLNKGTRGAPYEAEGQNSNVDVGIPTTAGRTQAQPLYAEITKLFPGGTENFFPGTNNEAAPDGPDNNEQTGYIWDSARRARLSVRNYGFYIDLAATYANVPDPYIRNSIQAYPTNPTLVPLTDPYFRSFDTTYPDIWRFNEWRREFRQFIVNGNLPQLSLVRLMHDHMGTFAKAIGGINTPETQQADNDFAVGSLVEEIANSPYKDNTLIFAIEDDSQDGPDHLNPHRSTAYIAGPYVKQKSVIHTRYTTVNLLRTIEDILGMDHLNLNDAHAQPMADVFDTNAPTWTFQAHPSNFLKNTVGAVQQNAHFAAAPPPQPTHTAAWWQEQTKSFDFSREDRAPAGRFNELLREGLGEAKP